MAILRNEPGFQEWVIYTDNDIPESVIKRIKDNKPDCAHPNGCFSNTAKSNRHRVRKPVTGSKAKDGKMSFVLLRSKKTGKERVIHRSCFIYRRKTGKPVGTGWCDRRVTMKSKHINYNRKYARRKG